MRDPMIDEVIKYYALYQIPSQITKTMKEKYGENAPAFYTIAKIRSQFRYEILEKRKEMGGNLAILDAEDRWAYLQSVLDDAMTEQPIVIKGKLIGYSKDLKSALEALKLANTWTEQRGAVQPENETAIRNTIMDAFDQLRERRPTLSLEEVIETLVTHLGAKYKPYIEELRDEPLLLTDGRPNSTES